MSLRKLTSLIGILAVIGLVAFILFGFTKTNDQSPSGSQSDPTAASGSETNGVLSDGAGSMASQSDESNSGVEIVDSGFGQNQDSAVAIVIAKSTGGNLVGEFVTATVNFIDEGGAILATEDRVEQLTWSDQELVLPVMYFKTNPNSPEVSRIEAFVSVSDYGMREAEQTALPVLESTEITDGYFNDYSASFGLKNDSSEEMKDLRVGAVCYNDQEEIIGGGYAFPSFLPAGGTIRIEATVTASEMPTSCKAYVGH
ncbi:hypothetical protein [Corynebacterium glutamicum]|uniref:hypothetical protein n=1 Tax=Corynebacterium glutamicum TaxID=1718 RepID=UPI000744C12F|nr:hypothetical protein [Corynebacterium glutamicum]ALZ99865.1 hypothetical protein APT58_06235 [Corynebacterium glutamicum]